MTWHILNYSDSNPTHLFDPIDEWRSVWKGCFFVTTAEYKRYKKNFDGTGGVKIKGHLFEFKAGELVRDKKLSPMDLRKTQRYVERLPDGDVKDLRKWIKAHGEEYKRDRFSELYGVLTDEAIEFFETHLVDDDQTVWMLEKLEFSEERLRAYGLRFVMEGALFLRALDLCDVERAEELPVELPESTRNIINGSRSKAAMEEYCDGSEEREAAAVLNTLVRMSRHHYVPYKWAHEIIYGGVIADDASTLFKVVEGYY